MSQRLKPKRGGCGFLLGHEADGEDRLLHSRWNFITSDLIFDELPGPQLRSSLTASPQGADAAITSP